MTITHYELITGDYQIEVIIGRDVYGFSGTCEEVEELLVNLYRDKKTALKKMHRFAYTD